MNFSGYFLYRTFIMGLGANFVNILRNDDVTSLAELLFVPPRGATQIYISYVLAYTAH